MISIDAQQPFPPCPAPFNLADHVLAAGRATPDRIALAVVSLSGAERLNYRDLRQAVLATATGLLDTGAEPGDRVLLRLGNTPDFPIAFLAAIAAGLIPVPTSSQLTVEEITGMADQVQPALVIAQDGIACPAQPLPRVAVETLRAMREGPQLTPAMGDPDRPAYIVFTSGTSGRPRGVVHAHRAIWARRMMWNGWYGLKPDDRILHAGAFNWTYTLGTGLMDPWAIGATALIPGKDIRPEQLPLLLKRYDATIFAAAPGVFRQMLRSPLPPLPRLRHGLSAGEKLSDGIRAAFAEATGLEIHEAFGMSECSTFISGSPGRPAPQGSLGFPQPGRNIAIVSENGPVDCGQAGTIAVHRDDPGLMLGYWNAPEETAARYAGDWFLTGDNGVMSEDGAISYLGRSDDMMNAGGYRVSPLEVEAAMTTHPDISECAAVEISVKADTTVIALYYTGTRADDASLAGHAEAYLARYKQPRLFFHVPALPRGANNKLIRRALRDAAGRDEAAT